MTPIFSPKLHVLITLPPKIPLEMTWINWKLDYCYILCIGWFQASVASSVIQKFLWEPLIWNIWTTARLGLWTMVLVKGRNANIIKIKILHILHIFSNFFCQGIRQEDYRYPFLSASAVLSVHRSTPLFGCLIHCKWNTYLTWMSRWNTDKWNYLHTEKTLFHSKRGNGDFADEDPCRIFSLNIQNVVSYIRLNVNWFWVTNFAWFTSYIVRREKEVYYHRTRDFMGFGFSGEILGVDFKYGCWTGREGGVFELQGE